MASDLEPLLDAIPGGASSSPRNLTKVGDSLFFTTRSLLGSQLWSTDGTLAGTAILRDLPGISSDYISVADVSGTLFFTGYDQIHGKELWKSDGTTAGTVMVKDIRPGDLGGLANEEKIALLNVNGVLYFSANDGNLGEELWKSDGTVAGTVIVKDIQTGALPSSPAYLTNLDGSLYFATNDGINGAELWKSDGTSDGTTLIKGILPGSDGISLTSLTNVNRVLFFVARDANGSVLWKSDGTQAGTSIVKEIEVGELVDVDGSLFFTAFDESSGVELWKTDGTETGTMIVKDINVGDSPSFPSLLTSVNGILFFQADEGANGIELWKSDGTAAGTTIVKDIVPGAGGSQPQFLTNVNGKLYFNATNEHQGYELWTSDGTAAGTAIVKDIAHDNAGSYPRDFLKIGPNLFFSASTASFGRELYLLAPPKDVTLSNSLLFEHSPENTLVGIFSTTDLNSGESFTYSLSTGLGDQDNSSFSIIGGELIATVSTNFEVKSSYSIRVRSTDSTGLSVEKQFTILIGDLDEIAPTIVSTSFMTSGAIPSGTTELTVSFSEPVLRAENVSSYELRQAGVDGILLSSDGFVNPSSIVISGKTAVLSFLTPFVKDTYRLTVRETIADGANNALDGDADGIPGTDWRLDFVANAINVAPSNNKIYLIGNSLTADTVPGALEGRVKWHIDCGKSLQEIYDFPTSPCQSTSTTWDVALRSTQYDVLVVQPHFGTDLEQDTAIITEWLELQPRANLVIHTGWTFESQFEATYHAPITSTSMTHSPAYFELLSSQLRAAFPDRDIRVNNAIQLLDSIYHDIENENSPFISFQQLYRDAIHMDLAAGRYLMHNLMRISLGQPLNHTIFGIDSTIRDYINSKLLMITGPLGGTGDLISFTSPNDFVFDVDPRSENAGQLIQGQRNSFDGLNRLRVGGTDFAPTLSHTIDDDDHTVATASEYLSGLKVDREIYVASTGFQDFTRTIESFANISTQAISVPVSLFGNLGSDSETNVFATSDGDLIVEPTDTWFGTDDSVADGGVPPIIHFVRSQNGLNPTSVAVIEDNVSWTFEITVPAGATKRLATFTLTSNTRQEAIDAAAAFQTINGFTGTGADVLSADELASLVNFRFNEAPTDILLSNRKIIENNAIDEPIGNFTSVDNNISDGDSFAYSLVVGTGDSGNSNFEIVGNTLLAKHVFDYETNLSYSIRVRSIDSNGLSFEKVLVIEILDQLEGSANDDTFMLTYSGLSVSVSLHDGSFTTNLGTFPHNLALTLDGLGGNDSVIIVGTVSNDVLSATTGSVRINNSTLKFKNIESLKLSGGDGNDTYRLDADTFLIPISVDDGNGIDVLDFSLTDIPISVNLAITTMQPVNANLNLLLQYGDSIENIIGGNGNDLLIGNALPNRITGNRGNDTLNGALGSDVLIGGPGNDNYLFHSAINGLEADSITELPNEGIDTINFNSLRNPIALNLGIVAIQKVHTDRTLKLSSAVAVENAVGGSNDDTLIGNLLSNSLFGNAGNDSLNGSTGSDKLTGGTGDDNYVFAPSASGFEADSVIELANQGNDTLNFANLSDSIILNLGSVAIQNVHTNRTLKLNSGATFENVFSGSGNDRLTGNSLSNVLNGNAGNDSLNGSTGSDSLLGGLGNDTYVFSPVSGALESDSLTELPNQGTDTLDFSLQRVDVVLDLNLPTIQSVHTGRRLKLGSGVTFENVLGGLGGDMFVGNSLGNLLVGNGGNDVLVGNAGNDQLLGGSGNDVLIGGIGQDALDGGDQDDILIAGRTSSDGSMAILKELSKEWISAKPYAARIANLRAGVGPVSVSLKAKINVLTDTSADTLIGGLGTDWYFRAADDAIGDLFAGEAIDLL